jgi:hypothetical protein
VGERSFEHLGQFFEKIGDLSCRAVDSVVIWKQLLVMNKSIVVH